MVVGLVDLEPVEADEAERRIGEEEQRRVEPGLGHPAARASAVQPPCSAWPANARLLTSSHAALVGADLERPDRHAGRPLRLEREGEATHLVEVARVASPPQPARRRRRARRRAPRAPAARRRVRRHGGPPRRPTAPAPAASGATARATAMPSVQWLGRLALVGVVAPGDVRVARSSTRKPAESRPGCSRSSHTASPSAGWPSAGAAPRRCATGGADLRETRRRHLGDGRFGHGDEGTVAAVARPRGAKARAAAAVELLRELYPDVHCALDHSERLRAARGDDPVGADHRRARQHGHPDAVREVSDPGRSRPPTRPRSSRSSSRPASSARRRRTSWGWRRWWSPASTARSRRRSTISSRCPGVGRKTANVVRSVWFHEPGLPVDTHVTRLSARLKLTAETDPVKIEHDLGAIVPPAEWGDFSLRLIEHGRRVCDARRRAAASARWPASARPPGRRIAGAILRHGPWSRCSAVSRPQSPSSRAGSSPGRASGGRWRTPARSRTARWRPPSPASGRSSRPER